MNKLNSNLEGRVSKYLGFILVVGLLLGILSSLNFLLIYVIGYGAIYTGILMLILNMYLIINIYEKYFKSEMKLKENLLVGIPILFLLTIVNFLIIDYDFKGTVTYSYYRNGYFFHVLEESGKQFIPISLIFIVVFAPIYRLIIKKKGANTVYSK